MTDRVKAYLEQKFDAGSVSYDGPQGTRCKQKRNAARKTRNAASKKETPQKKANAINKKGTLQTKSERCK